MEVLKEKFYTEEEFDGMEFEGKAEYINGTIYLQARPNTTHQRIISFINTEFGIYLKGKACESFTEIEVRLKRVDDIKLLVPDISIVCDKDLLDTRGCNGAPSLIVEIVSPSSVSLDYLIKLNWYKEAGVREYWIVNPMKKTVIIYKLDLSEAEEFLFSDIVPVGIFNEELKIDFNQIEQM